MKETTPSLLSSRASTHHSQRPPSNASYSVSLPSRAQSERPRVKSSHRGVLSSRASESRQSSISSQSSTNLDAGSFSGSLSALYEPAFKPYQFSHMYNTKYQRDYPFRYWPKPAPDRAESTQFAPIDYRFDKTTYQQHYKQLEPIGKAFVVPYSRHRNNKPHPQKLVNTWAHPDSSRWIWSNPTPKGDVQNKKPNTALTTPVYRGAQDHFKWHRWYSR